MTTAKPRWGRLAGEAVLIIVSILLAFAIDAWWAGVQERREEQRVLANLWVEFSETRDLLISDLDIHRENLRRALDLAALAGTDERVLSPEVLRSVARLFLLFPSFHSKSATLDGLLAAGRLGVISDERLRSQLAAWPHTVDEFTEQQVFISQWVMQIVATLPRDAPLSFVAEAVAGASPDALDLGQLELAPGMRSFLVSEHAASLASVRAVYEWMAVRDGEHLMTQIDEIIDLIEDQRGGSESH